ncbi:MAG: cytochrome c, partial [Myxococcota bacterium]
RTSFMVHIGDARTGTDCAQPAGHGDGHHMDALNDEYLFEIIADGDRAVGKSETMASWSGYLSDGQIHDIIAFIRPLADPPYSN